MSLVSQARSLGKYFLLLDNLLVVLGFFVVFPLISIRFVDQLGWAALIVGIALGLRQLLQQGLGIFGGAVADRFGAKPMIVTGMREMRTCPITFSVRSVLRVCGPEEI